MFKYTLVWISRWIVMGPRLWVWLLLVVSMVVVAGLVTDGRMAAWWVWSDERSSGWAWQPSRTGCWVWRLLGVIHASSTCLVCRVGLLAGLLAGSGLVDRGPAAWCLLGLPIAEWTLGVLGWIFPRWSVSLAYQDVRGGLHRAYQWSVIGLGLLMVQRWLTVELSGVVLGSLAVCERDGSRIELEAVPGPAEQTTYRAQLSGTFVIEVTPRDEFEKRLFILNLRQLRTPGREASTWGIVRQEDLAKIFQVTQEEISRWQRYVREGRWAQLLSVSNQSLLTDEVRQQIVEVWAANIWQTAPQVWARLAQQGVAVAERLVEEAGRQSGLMTIRAHLKEQFSPGPEGLRPRAGYVTEQLFKLVDQLQAQVSAGQAAPCEGVVDVTALRQITGVAAPAQTLEKPWPWLFQVEHWLFGEWQLVDDGTLRCPHCGSEHIARKSRTPRRKAYLDERGQRQTVEVYRYYCKNPDCSYQTFTSLPPGLIAYSVWTLDARLKALELYTGLRTNYRSAANALGVAPSTLYHWLEQFGAEPLQVAALFGLVRSSGVVGLDEKYVKVPKNNKPAGKQRKWMYVYVAVDVHTLDLLHIAIFPHLGKDSARTFLLELRAKGYHPRVIVTDMNQDYTEPLAQVFPNAMHHECVFHALQFWHRQFKDAFGRDYQLTHPAIFKLRQQLDHVFQAKTRRTVEKRYTELMAQREELVRAEPGLAPILDSLARHYPNLVNAYDRPLIPLTNNATERLIRRFDQHYQNFAGFDSIETARCYLHLFELTYRFTPFGPEVQPHLRGKCPLELAGYDLTHIPLASYLHQHGTAPLVSAPAEVVPK